MLGGFYIFIISIGIIIGIAKLYISKDCSYFAVPIIIFIIGLCGSILISIDEYSFTLNSKTIEANIVELGPKEFHYVHSRGRPAIGGWYCTRNIIYSYCVDNVTYTKVAILDGMFHNLNIKNKDTITIIYNIDNPNDSRIKTKYNLKICLLILLIIIGIVLYIKITGSTPLKNTAVNIKKGKIICLKVLKIEIIDYEREMVFFENSEKQLYYYETDFGEDFEINDEYEIILNNSTQKKSKIEYEGNIEKCIQIINIEKKEFFKKT